MKVSDVIEEVRHHLQGSMKDKLNLLATPLAGTETNVVLEDELSTIGVGTVLEVGLEQMHVRATDPETKQVTVVRGVGTSTATIHQLGDIVRIDPSFYAADILQAINDEIAQLRGVGLAQFETVEIDLGATERWDILPFTLEAGTRPLYVQQAWQQEHSGFWRPVKVDLVEDLNDGSEHGLRVISEHHRYRSRAVKATVACQLALATSADDELSSLGLTDTARQIIPFGAAWKMVLRKEAQRLNPDHSHGSRRAEEVENQSLAFLGRALQSTRQDLIQQALDEQTRRYAPRARL